jgi:hypothetical protein
LAQKNIDPETGRSVDPAEVGGLHQVVSEPTDFLFAYHRQEEECEGIQSETINWYQSLTLFVYCRQRKREEKEYSDTHQVVSEQDFFCR